MVRAFRWIRTGLAVVGISLAATGVLILTSPDEAITLLVYLPGITIVEALFGVWGGIAAVLLSVSGSVVMRILFLEDPLQMPIGYYCTWEEEVILLVVGLFVVALMERRRRSGAREVSGAHQRAALLENVADAVVILDRSMRVAALNPAARALLNRPGETVIGASLEELRQRFSFTNTSGTEPPSLEQTLRLGAPVHEEGTIVDLADHRRIHVLISFAPWRNAKNQIEGALVLLTDVTALKELQVRALDSARHLALGQMISGLTHDFNHVLDIIRRANAVLEMREEAPAAERRKYREMIERAAQDGSAIVRRLRDYLAGGTGASGRVDLSAAAREAVELTGPLWRTRPEIELVTDLEPVAPVRGNLNDLRRVLTNLIFNAVEALDSGGGRVQVHTGPCAGAASASPHVCAWVEDNGRGIPPEIQRQLFQPYVTTKPHGMGIGLFGAQKIMLAHGGKLSYASMPGGGTRFTIELPVMANHQGNADAA